MSKKLQQILLSPWSIIIMLSLLEVFVSFFTTYSGLTFDEAIWHYIGRNWFRHGMIPYSGGIDNKSPLIYIIYGISDLLFGVNYWFPRLLAIVSQAIGLYFVYRITKHLENNTAGIISIILYGLSLTWKSTDGKFVSQAQAYEITFLIIAFYYYFIAGQNKQFFFSGIMAGIAIVFKLTAALPSLIIFLLLLHRKKIPAPFIYASGALTTICIALVSFLLLGINLHDLFVYSLLDNFTPGSVTDHPFAWKFQQFINQFFYSGMVLFYPFIIAWIIIKRKMDVFTLWLIASFAGICIIGMFARSHLKDLLPPLTIISALSIYYLLEKYAISLRSAVIILLIIFFPKTTEPFFVLKKFFSSNPATISNSAENLKKQFGLWIKSNTNPAEKVYIAGYSAEAQVYSERLSPSVYFNVTQTPVAKRKLFFDLEKNKPAMIAIPLSKSYTNVVDTVIQQHINNLVAKDYREDTCFYGYKVYRKKNDIILTNYKKS
jgi:hypothetical protein